METASPAASFSSSSNDGHPICSVDLNKKRKLQDESGNLDNASPKQRFRVGTNIFGQGLMIRGGFLEESVVREIQNDLVQPEESEKDSNSFIGAYDNSSMSSDATKDSNENSIALTIHQNQPSTSLNSCSNEVLKTHLYSLESRVMKKVNNVGSADLEDTLQYDTRHKVMEDMHSGFGLDNAITELAGEADAETEETMILNSNDIAPHSFILSSGRWNLGEGAPLGARRPTIDQEFEQYFSSLLL